MYFGWFHHTCNFLSILWLFLLMSVSDFLSTKLIKAVANDGLDLDIVIGHSWVRGKKVHIWNSVVVKSVFQGFSFFFLYFS